MLTSTKCYGVSQICSNLKVLWYLRGTGEVAHRSIRRNRSYEKIWWHIAVQRRFHTWSDLNTSVSVNKAQYLHHTLRELVSCVRLSISNRNEVSANANLQDSSTDGTRCRGPNASMWSHLMSHRHVKEFYSQKLKLWEIPQRFWNCACQHISGDIPARAQRSLNL